MSYKSINPVKNAYLREYSHARAMIAHYPEFDTQRVHKIIRNQIALQNEYPDYARGIGILNAWRTALPLAAINDRRKPGRR